MDTSRFSKIPTVINEDLSPAEHEDWVKSYLHHAIYLLGEAMTRLRGPQPAYDANPLDDLLPAEGAVFQIEWMKWLADRHLVDLDGPRRTRMQGFYSNLFDTLLTATRRPMPAGWEDRT